MPDDKVNKSNGRYTFNHLASIKRFNINYLYCIFLSYVEVPSRIYYFEG
jgi:hypothetical protein